VSNRIIKKKSHLGLHSVHRRPPLRSHALIVMESGWRNEWCHVNCRQLQQQRRRRRRRRYTSWAWAWACACRHFRFLIHNSGVGRASWRARWLPLGKCRLRVRRVTDLPLTFDGRGRCPWRQLHYNDSPYSSVLLGHLCLLVGCFDTAPMLMSYGLEACPVNKSHNKVGLRELYLRIGPRLKWYFTLYSPI